MATPRRFADKIAQLKQNQEAGTRAFEEIMKKPVYELEVCTVVVFFFLMGENSLAKFIKDYIRCN